MNKNAVGFPPPQQVGDTHTIGDVVWEWDGTAWVQQGSSGNGTGGGGIEEAPNDGQMYARQYQAPWGMGWTPFTPGSGGGGGIQDGDTVGQVTTWSGSAWTPDSSLTIDSSGKATFSGWVEASSITSQGSISGSALTLTREGLSMIFNPNNSGAGTNSFIRAPSGVTFDIGNADNVNALRIDASGDATFSGTVDAAGFTVNGQPIGGGGNDFSSLVTITNANYRQHLKLVRSDQAWHISPSTAGTIIFSRESGSGTAAVNAPDFLADSDERLKDNITTAPVGLIDSLKGREWDWSESGEKGSGVVAQELEQVLPHLVHEDDEGMKSVSYNGLVAYLIEEVKALKAEVEALK